MKHLTILFLLLMPGLAISATTDFSRTLYVGMRGEDVRALQKFLNTDNETRVAEVGAGSVGGETDYFGAATKRALIKFQEKYREEILVPVGLTAGSGIFGPKTREKILSSTKKLEQPATISIKDVPKLSISDGKVYVMFPSQYSGTPGTIVTIMGAGFTETENTINFGKTHAVLGAKSQNGQSISFKIPKISKGLYSLSVNNAHGESNKDQWFVVTDGVSPSPRITGITPAVLRGDKVTINGTGFLPKGNTVMVGGVGLFKDVSSADGVTLSFVVPTNAFPVAVSPKISKPSFKIVIYVINENGVSNEGRTTINP